MRPGSKCRKGQRTGIPNPEGIIRSLYSGLGCESRASAQTAKERQQSGRTEGQERRLEKASERFKEVHNHLGWPMDDKYPLTANSPELPNIVKTCNVTVS